ncbi:MAG: hypothetical protein LBT92_03315 [Rickettsiales bacterium]|nr:hypothetical protein [Rickettsiales bacterium]
MKKIVLSLLVLAACSADETVRLGPDEIARMGSTRQLADLSFHVPNESHQFIELAGDISFVARGDGRTLDYVMLSDSSGLESKFPVNSFRRLGNGFLESDIVQTSPIYGWEDSDGTWYYDVSSEALVSDYGAPASDVKLGQARLNMKLLLGGAQHKMAYADFGMFVGVTDIRVGSSQGTLVPKYIPFVASFEQYRTSSLPAMFSATFDGGAVASVARGGSGASRALLGSARLSVDTAAVVGSGKHESLRVSFDDYYTITFNDSGKAFVSGSNGLGIDFNIHGGCKAGCYGDITSIGYYGPTAASRPVEAAGYFFFKDSDYGGAISIEGVFGVKVK